VTRQDERAIAIAWPGDPSSVLEGVFVAGQAPDAAGAVIAPPHPLYGGSLESPVVAELAHACGSAGIASVRFNWRGVGASAGERSGEAADADADYAAALEHLAESVSGPLLAAGYSFGAAAALRAGARSPRIRRLVLVAPPPTLLDESALAAFAGRVLLVAGGSDELAPASALEPLVEGEPRRALEVIPEADHFFMDGLATLGRIVAEWLSR
jgi:alpha/beta superfamily hydrolase